MKPLQSFSLLLSLAALLPAAHAEIHADLHLRHGDDPLGVIRIDLHIDRAPRPAANFIGLATGQFPWIHPESGHLMTDTPYYDGQIFHRLIHNFIIQGGDPTGTGSGGPGYIFQDQYHPDLRHNTYNVSMAHAGPGTNGSQFFLLLGNAPWLDDFHSVFGSITDTDSRNLLDTLTDPNSFPTDEEDRPLEDIIIDQVVIGGDGLDTFDLFNPELRIPRVNGVRSRINSRTNTEGDTVQTLEWESAPLKKYPIGVTNDPATPWGPNGDFYYTMSDDAPKSSVNIAEPNPGEMLLVKIASVDYSMIEPAPLNLLVEGATLTLGWFDGELEITFGNVSQEDYGSWSYTDPNGATSQGPLLYANTGENVEGFDAAPLFPSEGGGISEYSIDYLFLTLRTLYLVFDDAGNGPNGTEVTGGSFTFHGTHSGWYHGQTESGNAREPFTWTPPSD